VRGERRGHTHATHDGQREDDDDDDDEPLGDEGLVVVEGQLKALHVLDPQPIRVLERARLHRHGVVALRQMLLRLLSANNQQQEAQEGCQENGGRMG
jgi:hypothetical protein